jgi:hypothetical protein
LELRRASCSADRAADGAPGIAVGVSLALMEAINDIGAVEFFGVGR